MTARLKLPPYGKQLLMDRRQGKSVRSIHLVYSERMDVDGRCDESCDGSHPRIVMKPSEFRPFTYDWTLVTGCLVAVFDCTEIGAPGRRLFYELLGELGRFAGPVQCYWWLNDRWQFAWDAARLATPVGPGATWPFWWPPETEALNAPRRRTWWDLHEHGQAAAAA